MTEIMSKEQLQEYDVLHSAKIGVLTIIPENVKYLTLHIQGRPKKFQKHLQVRLAMDLGLAESLGRQLVEEAKKVNQT